MVEDRLTFKKISPADESKGQTLLCHNMVLLLRVWSKEIQLWGDQLWVTLAVFRTQGILIDTTARSVTQTLPLEIEIKTQQPFQHSTLKRRWLEITPSKRVGRRFMGGFVSAWTSGAEVRAPPTTSSHRKFLKKVPKKGCKSPKNTTLVKLNKPQFQGWPDLRRQLVANLKRMASILMRNKIRIAALWTIQRELGLQETLLGQIRRLRDNERQPLDWNQARLLDALNLVRPLAKRRSASDKKTPWLTF